MSVEFGINFMPTAPAREVVDWARAVERHGYAILGLSDSQSICRDVYVTLGLCAANTERIRLGPRVITPVTRHPAVAASAAATLAELAAEHPVGVGLGGGAGTSYPSFLAAYAPRTVGAENEYVRIAVEQGIPGLILWCAFIFWILRHVPRIGERRALLFYRSIYAFVFISWSTAFIGTGVLMSVPSTVLMMLYMGRLATMGAPRRGL